MDFGCQRPKIAILALNPHGGENGKIGKDEIEKISPAIKKAEDEKIIVQGPFSADSFFGSAKFPNFDGILAMYHDQGHIPVKLLGFSVDPTTGRWIALSGVNVTLGLPLIRTSVDHGTAFDIAGQGIADETSLIEAIDYALKLAAPAGGQPMAEAKNG
jgi:4-hydroxythreonine-4-phosphate dehydrogenase